MNDEQALKEKIKEYEAKAEYHRENNTQSVGLCKFTPLELAEDTLAKLKNIYRLKYETSNKPTSPAQAE